MNTRLEVQMEAQIEVQMEAQMEAQMEVQMKAKNGRPDGRPGGARISSPGEGDVGDMLKLRWRPRWWARCRPDGTLF